MVVHVMVVHVMVAYRMHQGAGVVQEIKERCLGRPSSHLGIGERIRKSKYTHKAVTRDTVGFCPDGDKEW